MTMTYDQWKGILSAVNEEEDLSKDNVIEKIKEKLSRYSVEHDQLSETGFDASLTCLNIEYTSSYVGRGFFGLPSICNKVEIHQRTLFTLAAVTGCVKIVEALIEKGIDINATDEEGLTPLHEVVGNGNVEVMNVLIKKGANVNAVSKDGNTLLHAAACVDNKEIVEFLIKKSLNINLANKDGYSPLHFAAEKNNKEVVEVLIYNGANVNAASKDGYTPLHFAASSYFSGKIVETLIIRGCKY